METEWEGDLGGPAAWTPAAAALEPRLPPWTSPNLQSPSLLGPPGEPADPCPATGGSPSETFKNGGPELVTVGYHLGAPQTGGFRDDPPWTPACLSCFPTCA